VKGARGEARGDENWMHALRKLDGQATDLDVMLGASRSRILDGWVTKIGHRRGVEKVTDSGRLRGGRGPGWAVVWGLVRERLSGRVGALGWLSRVRAGLVYGVEVAVVVGGVGVVVGVGADGAVGAVDVGVVVAGLGSVADVSVVGEVVVAVCSGWFVAVGVDEAVVVVASGVVVLAVPTVVDADVVVELGDGAVGELLFWVVIAAAGDWWVAARMAASCVSLMQVEPMQSSFFAWMLFANKSPMPFAALPNQAMRLLLKSPEMEAMSLIAPTMGAMRPL